MESGLRWDTDLPARRGPSLGYAPGPNDCVLGGGDVPACFRFDPHPLRGHFAGSAVLHWPSGAEGRGVLCTGGTIHVAEDHRYVTFMYSYVNYIPLSGVVIRRITERLLPPNYDRIYGCFGGWVVTSDAQSAVARSATRYLAAISNT